MRRKILSTILALCMVMSMLPMTAFAFEGTVAVTFDFGSTGITLDDTALDTLEASGTDGTYNVKDATSDATFKLDTSQATIEDTQEVKVVLGEGEGAKTLEADDQGVYTLAAADYAATLKVTVTIEDKTPADTTFSVAGKVTAAEGMDGVSVEGIAVNLYAKADTTFESSLGNGTTDAQGAYTINNKVEAGEYVVMVVAATGKYVQSTADVTVSNANVTDANIELQPEATTPPEPGEPVEITEVNIVISTNKIQAGDTAKFPVPTVTTVTADENEAAATVETAWATESGTASAPTAAGEYTATFTVTEEEGYKLANTVKYTVNGKEVQANALTAVVTAVEEVPLDVKVAENISNGKVTVDPAKAYEGDTVTITATPAQGYEVDTVTVTDVAAADITKVDANTYTFEMPAKAVTVTVTFKEAPVATTYDITIAKDIVGGTVTTDPVGKAAADTEVTVTATPAKGYTLGEITVTDADGANVTVSDGVFTMPAKAVTVTATFTQASYTVTVSGAADENDNSVTTDKATAHYGDTVTLTPTLADGYGLKTLTIKDAEDNVVAYTDVTNDAGKITAYTFSMPASDVTVTATFVEIVDAGTATGTVASPETSSTVVGDGKDTADAALDALENGEIVVPTEKLQAAADKAAANVMIETADLTTATSKISAAANGTQMKAIKDAIDGKAADEALSTVVGVKTQVYMNVQITAASPVANGLSVTFDITPMTQTILVPADLAANAEITVLDSTASNIATANALPVGAAQPVAINDATEVSLPMPADFTADTLWVKHEKDVDYFYLGTLTDSVLTFTTNGFSPFTVYADAAGAGVKAQIGTNGYTSLAAAVAAATDKAEIKVLADVSTATSIAVPESAMTFTIKADDATYLPAVEQFVVTDAENWTVTATASADGKTITVVVAAKDAPGPNPGPGPSGGGGGGGGGVSSNVTIDKTTNGKVTVTPTAPSKGSTVTITLTPDTGYVVGTVTVTDKDGKAVELTKVSDTKYTFTMPDGKVKVAATFTKVADGGFTDVAADAYYADAVKWAVDKGITNGLTATTFGPNNSCTRGQMVTFLWRAAGSPKASATNSFTDVASGEYYYDAVLWAVEKGITNGTTATTFSPNATVNRGQTVTFLYRYAGSPAATGTTSFTDVAADAYYANAVKWAVAEEITNGTSSTTFAPASNCTRGQIVTFLYRQIAE